ncbi:Probable molybdopterin cofactor synthesis protein A [Slackia heliotrinireducens]|uniref:GTP 3',8-cyclase n=1 Tax=Slackia heliotrinireducens (strain ATCC 29202 / DSM 20476 / NCTC 11029 / RHS 1) TaxID=471855 RepID=C7N1E2_SLAHD|nr:GTP 3',8-cyclase MoaA [Slackia heliotrinireducens]ACV21234.1 GTP cyclohydrolase subunit MoaA [Slackia heliotrinireducens DSM 20476]VEG98668.1 Probable molybdopterin cofactor synthesis protein A [Slackia heliotrinireducens]
MKDSHGRVIDYLRISLTDRCNLRCRYCMPEEGVSALSHEDILSLEEIERIIRVAAGMGISRLRLTGGEPLVRKGIAGLIKEAMRTPGIESVALTTNGILLPKMAAELKEAGLSRVNISLDTLDEEQFHYITRRGHVADVMAGIDAALEAGFNPVKINAVVVRSLNQDLYEFARMSVDRPLHMRFIEYMPVGESAGYDGTGWGPQDVVSCDEVMETINARCREEGIPELKPASKHTPTGWGPARYYEFEGAKGTVGFISPLSRHFCSECNRLRMTADGKIRPCLFSDEELDVRAAVREGTDEDIRNVFLAALGMKPDEHHDKIGTERKMSQIGG